jgi:site-specific DNA-methyltransferase (adenine-specific)
MKTENIEYIKGDCLKVMSRYPDNYFDVAIVDPPYGINITKSNRLATSRGMGGKNWDASIPDGKYFDELFRVSRHQVIWGWNYFVQYLNACRCYLVWDKNNDGRDFADSESAYTSFDTVARTFRMRPMGMDGGKVHPAQKPEKLYSWIYHNFCDKDWRVLDTHLGSGSNAIAAHYFGVKEFVGVEIDVQYYEQAIARFKERTAQTALW